MPRTTTIQTGQTQNDVIQYYKDTARDYRILLRHRVGQRGMHYGYTDKNHSTLAETILNLNEQLAKQAGVRPQMKVLDVGCGVGGTVIWLAKNKGVEATGITIIPDQVKAAEFFAQQEGVQEKAKFFLRDMRNTKFPNDSFDVITGVESVCYMKDKKDFIKEAYRLLKPGGVLVMSDGFQRHGEFNSRQEKRMKRWLKGWAVPNLATIEEFTKDLKEVGFKNIHKRKTTSNILPFSRFLYKWGIVGYPLSKLLEVLRLRTARGTGNIIAAIWQYRTIKNGLWNMYIVSAQKIVKSQASK